MLFWFCLICHTAACDQTRDIQEEIFGLQYQKRGKILLILEELQTQCPTCLYAWFLTRQLQKPLECKDLWANVYSSTAKAFGLQPSLCKLVSDSKCLCVKCAAAKRESKTAKRLCVKLALVTHEQWNPSVSMSKRVCKRKALDCWQYEWILDCKSLSVKKSTCNV
jgi:hypothetical protein